ncbi:ATP-binding protein [Flavobacterium sp. M31R6]|uniref:ATP-binding protein n=1 Tax=Flavobacterium sp. M31R6 TaxID=2739062 RepID=UPI001569F8C1|nr:ATP-binding protein [Flavobacterium sp. M31R6]QKJ61742.1 putative DNA binding domain-containing protein [Flavobacterium sp. M31R6]
MENLKELVERLNLSDECTDLEAKRASEIGKSVLETVCAFSNEPGLGGGYLLLGVEREDEVTSLFPSYIVSGIPQENLDKIQADLANQCAENFNIPIRPQITVEKTTADKYAIVVFVPELSPEQKPLFLKHKGLPQGAYRRIGSADHKCTEDDLVIFYQGNETLDKSIIKDADLDDVSEEAISLYRRFRKNVNPSAEELTYDDNDLLKALNAIRKSNGIFQVTYTGLLCFGSRMALRRLLPMVRVDYIRVSTNKWIEDADKRFDATLDMRGSLLELVQRIISTISDDLPKGFVLNDNNIQAKNIGLPMRVLREAVVNALIHRSYRENSPIQIIRYPNRIEIINPGFSLKTEDQLGEPGSVNRNPFISAIFHETNLAETKGSGIRTMRSLMEKVDMMPPTFESSRENNTFTVRLLLHHLLNEEDIHWLNSFSNFDLNDNQKRILIFVREVNAIDNSTARQINGSDILTANADLRKLRELDLLNQKGKSKFTYYTTSELLKSYISNEEEILSALPLDLSALPPALSALPLEDDIPSELKQLIESLGKRTNDKEKITDVILRLCAHKPMKSKTIAQVLGKSEKYIFREFLKLLLDEKKLNYTIPDMINHPNQAYITIVKTDEKAE